MDVALYDPGVGYYRGPGTRIGYSPGADFLTATSSAPLFGRLVAEACAALLSPADAGRFEFVEVGAERGACVLDGVAHAFRSARTAGIGQELRLEGPTVVFSNELFDAQPFRRFRRRQGRWREIGVIIGPQLAMAELETMAPLPFELPADAPEGYLIDAPFLAAALCGAIARQPWTGLFLALDYGKTWEELSRHAPNGTARSYRMHVQGSDLLESPGAQDLTCHVCWDWLSSGLRSAGFDEPTLESQESFFTLRAGDFIGSYAAAHAGDRSREKLSLLQLLHPANLGQSFQALWSRRIA
jgi:SAM-dependent MidA family methyltransferase